MKKIWVLIVLLAIAAGAFFLYYKEGSLPVNSKNREYKTFIIESGESVPQIIRKLQNAELIRNRVVFFLIIKKMGIDNKIQAGEFSLSQSMSGHEIAKALTRGSFDARVTVIEGLRREEVAQIIARETDIPAVEFVKAAQEGYLFPDTYLIPKDATLEDVLVIFENNFNKKYDVGLKAKAQSLGLTDDQVITLASLVEKESKTDEDRQRVASILLKRLMNGWALNVDATIQYALGYQQEEKTWWKKNLTAQDLKIQSLYNTYERTGLPPGPICNPGLASIQAVLEADPNTPYWFYISSRDGASMHYATTIEEHNENIRKYLR